MNRSKNRPTEQRAPRPAAKKGQPSRTIVCFGDEPRIFSMNTTKLTEVSLLWNLSAILTTKNRCYLKHIFDM
jgi:hypothetical protein